MEKKADKILRKIHIKDYTNSLEKILDKKSFSTDTKNLLLSMLYKIENAYKDYEKTKVEVYDKGEFLDKLNSIIDEKCNEIIIVKSNSEASKLLEKEGKDFIIQKEEGKIIAVGNEIILLNCILEMAQEEICLTEEENLLQYPISYFLNTGNKMNKVESIRDFNGWSWDISIRDIENINLNIVFQTFLYLLGHEFTMQWIENKSQLADYLMLANERLKQNYGEERASKITKLLYKLIVEILIYQNKQQKEIWKKIKEDSKNEFEKINNKKQYLEEITKEKKKITKEIERIDKTINNKEMLQKEYEKRNDKLPNQEKIFSTKQLINILEIERQEYIDKMKKCNVLIEPNGYVARKEKINKEYEFFKSIIIDKKSIDKKEIIELCSLFFECFRINIEKEIAKQELIHYIYKLRYYCFLTFDESGTSLKDVEELKDTIEQTKQLLIKKTHKLNVIDNVTNDEEINYNIVSKIFDSKMIDLNNMVIQTKIDDGKLLVEYYDTNILETTIEVYSDRTVKLKKKTKVFI